MSWDITTSHGPSNTKAGIAGLLDTRQEFDLYETKENSHHLWNEDMDYSYGDRNRKKRKVLETMWKKGKRT